MNAVTAGELKDIYERRFRAQLEYRREVWKVLVTDFFQKYVRPSDTVVDLGCGYGEFINAISCAKKIGMDLNPDTGKNLDPSVQLLEQSCASPWQLPDKSVNLVFTSNFFEHLPDKESLGRTFDEIWRCLAPGGRLIAMGPNIKYLPGEYWDFWDHFLPLSEMSLSEGLTNHDFEILEQVGRFLPYRMTGGPAYPMFFVRAYLRLSILWPLFGKQFLVVAQKPARGG